MKKMNCGTIVLMIIGLMICVGCSQVSFNNPFGERERITTDADTADMSDMSDDIKDVSSDNQTDESKPIEHKIHYLNLKNADNSLNPTSFKESEIVMLTKVSISDFTFDGWYEVTNNIADTSTDGWNAGDRTNDVTLWAKWTANETNPTDPTEPIIPAAKVYTIRFDKNTGIGTMDDITADVGTTITLPTCTIVPPVGKKFSCWNGKADGTDWIIYNDGASVKNLSEEDGTIVTLYAQWIDKDAHRIIYQNTKNADNSVNPTSFKELEPVMLTDVSISGWTFDGWYDSSSEHSEANHITNWSAGEQTSDVTLWAKWTPAEVNYTVKRYFQNVSGDGYDTTADIVKSGLTGSITDVTADEVTGFTPCTIVQQKISADGSTAVSVYYDRNVIVYTFNANGGKWDDETNIRTAVGLFGAEVVSPVNPSRAGYSFNNWDAEVLTVFGDENKTFTAQWTERKYTVKFNANGGNGTMEDQSIFCDIPTTLTRNSFTKAKHLFVYWCTNSDGTGRIYNNGDEVTDLVGIGEDITLYAIWLPQYGLSANGNIVLDCVEYQNTSFVKVMDETVIVTGSDANWSSYLDSSATVQYKGAFIKNRNVKISPYSMSKYLVTQELYEAVMSSGTNYDKNSTDEGKHPAYYVSWYDAITFCNKLSLLMGKYPCYSVKENGKEIDWANYPYSLIPTSSEINWDAAVCDITKNGYRLPTEAEWEFAARGGDQTADDWKYAFSGIQSLKKVYRRTTDSDTDYGGTSKYLQKDDNLASVGWYTKNSSSKVHTVGGKTANRLGLYDMSGNLYEWCWDGDDGTVTSNDSAWIADEVVTNPMGAAPGSSHVLRGGSWFNDANYCCVSYRHHSYTYRRGHSLGNFGFPPGLQWGVTVDEFLKKMRFP